MSGSAPLSNSVTLRLATATDRDLLVAVFASTRADDLVQAAWPEARRDAFARTRFEAQDALHRTANPDGRDAVVQVDGRPAGRLYVDHRVDDIRIVDLTLLPQFRGAGIGRQLIAGVIDEAGSTGRTVSVLIDAHHRAAALYARLGFVAVAEHGARRRMEWRPR